MNLVERIPIGNKFPDTINCIIEIPKGTSAKYEYNEELNIFQLARCLYSSMIYTASYGFIPQTHALDDDPLDIIVYNNEFRDMYRKFIKNEIKTHTGNQWYYQELKKDFTKHKNEMKKTVMYLVKEFEMKKSATAYKRALTDKTGIIDPLKLKNYKFSDDIFKRLTILPNEKNHGMMMLLDWSGSMQDCLMKTVDQLLNLVWFCQKIRIPYDVYFFTSERGYSETEKQAFSNVIGEWKLDTFNLVNCVSHRMNKKQCDLALKTLYHMGAYFDNRYTRNWRNNQDADDYAKHDSYGIPSQYYLGNTPLNESLIYLDKLIPMFKKKYGIEKLTFITLTDGAGNYPRGDIIGSTKSQYDDSEYRKTNVYQIGKTKFVGRNNITEQFTVFLAEQTHRHAYWCHPPDGPLQ